MGAWREVADLLFDRRGWKKGEGSQGMETALWRRYRDWKGLIFSIAISCSVSFPLAFQFRFWSSTRETFLTFSLRMRGMFLPCNPSQPNYPMARPLPEYRRYVRDIHTEIHYYFMRMWSILTWVLCRFHWYNLQMRRRRERMERTRTIGTMANGVYSAIIWIFIYFGDNEKPFRHSPFKGTWKDVWE